MQITYTSVDGASHTRRFQSVKNARAFAHTCVGPQDIEGGSYAVSNDGVGKITWKGVSRRELFGMPPSKIRINQEHTFYRRGNALFCRLAGMTYDHERQQIGRIIELFDVATGDNFIGYGVIHNEGETPIIFNEQATFATIENALAHAKRAYLDYLDYLEHDAH
jgi:hypothetical protein